MLGLCRSRNRAVFARLADDPVAHTVAAGKCVIDLARVALRDALPQRRAGVRLSATPSPWLDWGDR